MEIHVFLESKINDRTEYNVRLFRTGKITVLQLSALLKQADSSKHKLTLTRLSSAPIPFTVLSLSGNPWNEDLLAVCGLKECHVLTFNSGGKDILLCAALFVVILQSA